ncbi:hypothetical protein JTE90_008336 [Oedothorax gibbosus]|uniref:Dynein heavy chain linker domain-containing protein n=1 Tax=Oedothorax gibbosus TaxID=931172 RepID=A0AAV6U138_9ARAC|nr:hypothetical protein JTE90_008336 [Oedothorax gibbosus]
MSKNNHRKATFIPAKPNKSHQESPETSEFSLSSLMESLFWQNLGWVHTPPFIGVHSDGPKLHFPGAKKTPSSSRLYLEKSFHPKIQVENVVPYGSLPKNIATDIEKRSFEKQDLKKILLDMGLRNNIIRPPFLITRNTFVILKDDPDEGIPQEPFLDLDIFDDDYLYETHSPQEWMALGHSDDQIRPVPGTAFIPVENDERKFEVKQFDWQKVAVLDYDVERKSYIVRNEKNCKKDPSYTLKTDEDCDLWVKRIYLKFDAEESLRFARRLHSAVATRHLVEDSIRMRLYVENMPIDASLPTFSKKDIDEIISVVRRCRQLQPKFQCIKNEIERTVEDLHIQFRKTVNFQAYIDVTGQNPNLIDNFENEPLGDIHKKYSIQNFKYFFKDAYEKFSQLTLNNQVGVIKALNAVQSEILVLNDMSLYSLSFNDVASLDRFRKAQGDKLQMVERYVHGPWISTIVNSIKSNIKTCDEVSYDTKQTVLHIYKLTKLGKLLRLVGFKMQDVMRFLVLGNLEMYSRMFQKACINLEDVEDGFTWSESFVSDRWAPETKPIFEISLEIRGVHLEFVVDLRKHREVVLELFDEGLRVTQGLPKLEKFVMKNLLYNPDDKLESVKSWEEQVVSWREAIIAGMVRATLIATAYVQHYDTTLEAFAEDPINYVKRLARFRATCEQLKAIVEKHLSEEQRLAEVIPNYMDIGPFRLVLQTVRLAAQKKHRQLADATIEHFHDRLRQDMESTRDQFLVLLDRIAHRTGNIEDLLDKKAWCRGVPKKIENLAEDVNEIRTSFKTLTDVFTSCMVDEDFSLYWKIQEFPQITAKRLAERTESFDQEREAHKENLSTDVRQLEVDLDNLSHQVSLLHTHRNISKTSATATHVRQLRKELTACEDKAKLYNKRQRLFGHPQTDYPNIEKMDKEIVPFEHFWLNAAEFFKYRERLVAGELVMEPLELKGKIVEFKNNLEKSLEYFVLESAKEIREAVVSVIVEVDEFLNSKWVLPERK